MLWIEVQISAKKASNDDEVVTLDSIGPCFAPGDRLELLQQPEPAPSVQLKSQQKLQAEESLTFETGLRTVYPNPFNPVTTIAYAVKEEDHVSIAVYNVLGRKVAALVDGVRAAGEHAVAFDATWLPSGAYFVRVETSAYRRTQMMMLAK